MVKTIHAKRGCDCPIHASERARSLLFRNGTLPESVDQTVPVRAHWRRQKGHLRKLPNTKAALVRELQKLLAARKREAA